MALAIFLAFTLIFYGLGAIPSIENDDQVSILELFWRTLLLPDISFRRVIPVIVIFQLWWLENPSSKQLIYKYDSPIRIIYFYYKQIMSYASLILSALLCSVTIMLTNQPFDLDEIIYSSLLLMNYILGVVALGGIVTYFSVRWNKLIGLIVLLFSPYIDQLIYLKFGISPLFFHGLVSNTLKNGTDFSTLIGETLWYLGVFVLFIFCNYLTVGKKEFK